MIRRWFLPLADQLAYSIRTRQLKVLGIVGSQGSGKSTLAKLLKSLLEYPAHSYSPRFNVAILSIDDFYLTLQERETLGRDVHPLLKTRGVPGTHDVSLALNTIDALKKQNNTTVKIPRFDKAIDDRLPENEWDTVKTPVDLVILEGWCVSNIAQNEKQLQNPINTLESKEDAEGIWRHYVNRALEQEYQTLWNKIDTLIMLKIPSFDLVYQWRQRQEDKLIQSLTSVEKNSGALKVMDELSIKRFIQHFERLTRHNLEALPEIADIVFKLDEQQTIVDKIEKSDTSEEQEDTERQWLVFTDLDGTLLDHYTYSYQAASGTLRSLESNTIPVIINTSKTFAEIIALRRELNNQHPFIVENGSAIYIPKNYFSLENSNNDAEQFDVICLGVERDMILDWLNSIKPCYPEQFKSFSEMGIDGIVSTTGLAREQATLANQRQFSEPLLWSGTDAEKQKFIAEAIAFGFGVLQGGRFLHILGNSDKGKATLHLKELYKKQYRHNFFVLAAGDSNNDIAMLDVSNLAVVVKSPTHDFPKLNPKSSAKVIHTEELGPLGWSMAVGDFLNEQLTTTT